MKADAQFLKRLLEVATRLAGERTLNPLMRRAVDAALVVFGAEYGYLVLLDEHGDLDWRACFDRRGQELETPQKSISQAILETVVQERQHLLSQAGAIDPDLPARPLMCAPLVARERLIGALCLEGRLDECPFSGDDLEAYQLFTAQVAVAVDNAMLNEDLETRLAAQSVELSRESEERQTLQALLEKMAATDPLTGIFNRRHFFGLAQDEHARALRYQRPFSLIRFEVDHFKRISDLHGRAVSDQVLAGVVHVAIAELRQNDTFARYGEEEFIILLPETGLEQAESVAERLRQRICALEIEIGGAQAHVTVSLGVACMNPDRPTSLEQVLELASAALADARSAGRDCYRSL